MEIIGSGPPPHGSEPLFNLEPTVRQPLGAEQHNLPADCHAGKTVPPSTAAHRIILRCSPDTLAAGIPGSPR